MNANFRTEKADWQEFQSAARSVGMTASDVLRDLMKAAIPYMQKYGRWYPPELIAAQPKLRVETPHTLTEGQGSLDRTYIIDEKTGSTRGIELVATTNYDNLLNEKHDTPPPAPVRTTAPRRHYTKSAIKARQTAAKKRMENSTLP